MIECIFTVDYEIFGNGTGSLNELVLEPGQRLKEIFDDAGAKLVLFVEAAEFEKIDQFQTDRSIQAVKDQIREFYRDGYEIGLHLHPQWANAAHRKGKWELDYSEYNLCTLPEKRIDQIVSAGIGWLRQTLGEPEFTPVSFRAGNWLFQPTAPAARVLVAHGIKIDSSVFKGGRQRKHGLDYRAAVRNPDYWRFGSNVIEIDAEGPMLELPTYTRMVPIWKLLTRKRVGLQTRASSQPLSPADRLSRLLDLARLWQPMKFDFCRMNFDELRSTVDRVLIENPSKQFMPLVAIGHTKDMVDPQTVAAFLTYLQQSGVGISTFRDVYGRHCAAPVMQAEAQLA